MPKAKATKRVRKAAKRIRAAAQRSAAPHAFGHGGHRRVRAPLVARGSSSAQTAALADAERSLGPITSQSGLDLTAKVKDLVRLAMEQGHLTYDDLTEALPDDVISPADLDQILTKLRALEIDIIDAAEVERAPASEAGDEEDEGRFDILDDPVRMYLRQMGKVALLTRDQEVEICKRIEAAEAEARRIIYSFGFTGK